MSRPSFILNSEPAAPAHKSKYSLTNLRELYNSWILGFVGYQDKPLHSLPEDLEEQQQFLLTDVITEVELKSISKHQ